MKYWECINVPGKTNVTSVDTSTSTLENTHELIANDAESSLVESIKENIQPEITIGYTHEFVNNEKVDELSDEYKRVFNQAFNKGEVKIDSVPGTDAVSVSVPADLPITTENPSEENDNKYVSVDEVDESNYDNTGEFEVPDLTPSNDSEIEISHPTENNQLDKDSIKESLLAGIFGNVGEEIADKVVDKLTEKVSEPEVVEVEVEPEYSLDEKQLNDVVETFNRYEREYFGELTAEHFSRRFLRNIPKHVYRAHQDCVDKYEAPDILDPLFFMYVMLTEDPYLAMGKFINIIRNKLKSDKTWSDAVDNLEIEYDEYVSDFADEDEEDDADAPSEETTDDTSESND